MTAPRLIALLVLAVLPLSMGQVAERTAGEDEFPALQLLPPGSVVEGISLPRYEEHRVTALITAKKMTVISRREVRMSGIRSFLYAPDGGDTTCVQLTEAKYDFRTKLMHSLTPPVALLHPRYTVRGTSVIFSNASRCGLVKGPVSTTFRLNADTNVK